VNTKRIINLVKKWNNTHNILKKKYMCSMNIWKKKVQHVSHQGNAHQNSIEIPSHPIRMTIKKTVNVGKDRRKNKPIHTLGGNVN
jgi:hypothetical protein